MDETLLKILKKGYEVRAYYSEILNCVVLHLINPVTDRFTETTVPEEQIALGKVSVLGLTLEHLGQELDNV